MSAPLVPASPSGIAVQIYGGFTAQIYGGFTADLRRKRLHYIYLISSA
jgi:hypothetical protein